MIKVDITGKKFNRLLVLEFAEKRRGSSYWKCICICGNIIYTTHWHMSSGNTQSCGCYHREKAREDVIKRNYKHGETVGGRSKIHSIWSNMLRRCYTESAVHYDRYGGRGIKVCKRWHTFINFKADMGLPPTKFHTIERGG